MTAAQQGCEAFEYTYRWGTQIVFPLDIDARRLLNERDLELEEWLNRCRCKCGTPTGDPFEYTHRWTQLPDDLSDADTIRLLDDHDLELERFLQVSWGACTGGGSPEASPAPDVGCEQFEYTYRWQQVVPDAQRVNDAERILNERDLELERMLTKCVHTCALSNLLPIRNTLGFFYDIGLNTAGFVASPTYGYPPEVFGAWLSDNKFYGAGAPGNPADAYDISSWDPTSGWVARGSVALVTDGGGNTDVSATPILDWMLPNAPHGVMRYSGWQSIGIVPNDGSSNRFYGFSTDGVTWSANEVFTSISTLDPDAVTALSLGGDIDLNPTIRGGGFGLLITSPTAYIFYCEYRLRDAGHGVANKRKTAIFTDSSITFIDGWAAVGAAPTTPDNPVWPIFYHEAAGKIVALDTLNGDVYTGAAAPLSLAYSTGAPVSLYGHLYIPTLGRGMLWYGTTVLWTDDAVTWHADVAQIQPASPYDFAAGTYQSAELPWSTGHGACYSPLAPGSYTPGTNALYSTTDGLTWTSLFALTDDPTWTAGFGQ